jgi:hypothetical protein
MENEAESDRNTPAEGVGQSAEPEEHWVMQRAPVRWTWIRLPLRAFMQL